MARFEDSLFARHPQQMRETLRERFVGMIPHNREIGLEFVDAGPGEATLRLPWQSRLIGNPGTEVIHGGVITTLIDSGSGLAVFCALPEIERIATLDLRIDYMRPATPGRDLYAWCECYRLTRQVAFVHAVAYQDSRDEPVATSVSTFMRSGKKPEKGKEENSHER